MTEKLTDLETSIRSMMIYRKRSTKIAKFMKILNQAIRNLNLELFIVKY